MTTFYDRPYRQRWRRDEDGIWSTAKDYDSILKYDFDLSRSKEIADDSTTISSITWVDVSGVTLTSKSNTTTTFSVTVQYTGEATARVVFADGQQRDMPFRWEPTDSLDSDYSP